jgi:CO/xanthine dehydrogenase FAD-binding subunit
MLMMKSGREAAALVSLRRLGPARGIQVADDGGIEIGAMAACRNRAR